MHPAPESSPAILWYYLTILMSILLKVVVFSKWVLLCLFMTNHLDINVLLTSLVIQCTMPYITFCSSQYSFMYIKLIVIFANMLKMYAHFKLLIYIYKYIKHVHVCDGLRWLNNFVFKINQILFLYILKQRINTLNQPSRQCFIFDL